MSNVSKSICNYQLYPLDPNHRDINYLLDFAQSYPEIKAECIVFHNEEESYIAAIKDDKIFAVLTEINCYNERYFGWIDIDNHKIIEVIDILKIKLPKFNFDF